MNSINRMKSKLKRIDKILNINNLSQSEYIDRISTLRYFDIEIVQAAHKLYNVANVHPKIWNMYVRRFRIEYEVWFDDTSDSDDDYMPIPLPPIS